MKHEIRDCNLSSSNRSGIWGLVEDVLFATKLQQLTAAYHGGVTWCNVATSWNPHLFCRPTLRVECILAELWSPALRTLDMWLLTCSACSLVYLKLNWKPSHIISRRWSRTQNVCQNSCFTLYTRNQLQAQNMQYERQGLYKTCHNKTKPIVGFNWQTNPPTAVASAHHMSWVSQNLICGGTEVLVSKSQWLGMQCHNQTRSLLSVDKLRLKTLVAFYINAISPPTS